MRSLSLGLCFGGFERNVKRISATYFQIITDSPNEARIMVYDVRSLEPEEQSEARARRNRTQDIVVRIIEQGIASGDFRPVDAKLVAMAIFSVTHWAVEWYHPDGPLDASAAAAVFVDLIVDGMAPRK